jgi:hypothetical protein
MEPFMAPGLYAMFFSIPAVLAAVVVAVPVTRRVSLASVGNRALRFALGGVIYLLTAATLAASFVVLAVAIAMWW